MLKIYSKKLKNLILDVHLSYSFYHTTSEIYENVIPMSIHINIYEESAQESACIVKINSLLELPGVLLSACLALWDCHSKGSSEKLDLLQISSDINSDPNLHRIINALVGPQQQEK